MSYVVAENAALRIVALAQLPLMQAVHSVLQGVYLGEISGTDHSAQIKKLLVSVERNIAELEKQANDLAQPQPPKSGVLQRLHSGERAQ